VRIGGERERKFDSDAEGTRGRACVKSQSGPGRFRFWLTPVKKADLPCELL